MRKAKKSLDEGTPIGVDFTNVEYAIERKILSTPSLELCYYADAAGEVPPLHLHSKQAGVDVIGNGDAGPEWGVDMIIRGGYIRYGPWADRQRYSSLLDLPSQSDSSVEESCSEHSSRPITMT